MKKILLTIIIFVFYANNYSQIQSSNIANIGDVVKNYVDSTTQLVSGNGGTGKLWNFIYLKTQDSTSIEYVSPTSTPYVSDFLLSNLCAKDDSNYTYYYKDNSKLEVVGARFKDFEFNDIQLNNVSLKPSSPMTMITFPMNYGDTLVDSSDQIIRLGAGTASGINYDSAKILIHNINTYKVDASGDIQMPNDTVSAIRQRITTTFNVIVYIKLPFIGWQETTKDTIINYSYSYWTSDTNYKFSIISYNVNNFQSNNNYGDIIWINKKVINNNISTNYLNDNALKLELYPNPSYDIVYLTETFDEINVYDTKSSLMLRVKDANKIDIYSLKNGIYHINAIKDNKYYTSNLIKK